MAEQRAAGGHKRRAEGRQRLSVIGSQHDPANAKPKTSDDDGNAEGDVTALP
jgi:hypothetical protein